MRKVLLVSHSQKSGGAERCLVEAAIGLRSAGFEMHVLIPSRGPICDLLESASIHYQVVSYPWWVHFRSDRPGILLLAKRIFSNIRYYAPMHRFIKALNPDVVVSNTLCVPLAALACRFQRRKHCWFIHEYGEEDHGLIFDLGFYLSSTIISRTANHVFVNSRSIKNKFSKHISKNRISIVQYDIPKPETPAVITTAIPPDKTVNLLLVGQIKATKGQLDAVRALEELLRRGYNAKLYLVGQIVDKQYCESIRLFIGERGIDKNVEFIDHAQDPFRNIHSFTIGLMCSQWEALGRVTIEYMKLGIPVIGADSGTTAFLIRHGENGLLYALREPLDLVKQVEYMLESQPRLDMMVRRAKDFSTTNFNSERFVSGLVAHL